jgi:hypothetical protein
MKITKNTLPSNRDFGVLFAGLFALLSAYLAYHGADALSIYSWLVASVIVGLTAIIVPGMLTPFNKAWMKLGNLMGKVVSPFVLGTIFFLLISPTALLTRLFGRDELRLKRSNYNTYWIERTPPGPTGESFKNQF